MQDYRGSLATITPCISYCVSFSLQILAPKLIQQLARYNNYHNDNEYSSYMNLIRQPAAKETKSVYKAMKKSGYTVTFARSLLNVVTLP